MVFRLLKLYFCEENYSVVNTDYHKVTLLLVATLKVNYEIVRVRNPVNQNSRSSYVSDFLVTTSMLRHEHFSK